MSDMDFKKLDNGFINTKESWDDETAARAKNADKILSFGVSYLDHALDGIEVSDLICLGAASGRGKTQMCSLIAMHNALAGKRVHFFALEAEDHEILRRMKYTLFVREYFEDRNRKEIPDLRFSQFRLNKYAESFKQYENKVKEEYQERVKNLYTYYRNSVFDANTFARTVASIECQSDLILLDHLNYFDLDSKNENKALSDAVKSVRRVQQDAGIPVVMAAHVRKKSFGDAALVPSIEDFHGSSDTYKVATKAIMMAPCYDPSGDAKHLKTYIHAVKHRHDGTVNRYVGLTTFDLSSNSYLESYKVGTLALQGQRFDSITVPADVPVWAKGHESFNPKATRGW